MADGITCSVCGRPVHMRRKDTLCSAHYVQYWIRKATDPDEIVDEIAIERAMRGDRVELTTTEKTEAVRRLTARGHSAADIAERLRVSERHVQRYRQRISLMAVAS